MSVRPSVSPSVGPSVPSYFPTITRRILSRVSGLIFFLFWTKVLSQLLFFSSLPAVSLFPSRQRIFFHSSPAPRLSAPAVRLSGSPALGAEHWKGHFQSYAPRARVRFYALELAIKPTASAFPLPFPTVARTADFFGNSVQFNVCL